MYTSAVERLRDITVVDVDYVEDHEAVALTRLFQSHEEAVAALTCSPFSAQG